MLPMQNVRWFHILHGKNRHKQLMWECFWGKEGKSEKVKECFCFWLLLLPVQLWLHKFWTIPYVFLLWISWHHLLAFIESKTTKSTLSKEKNGLAILFKESSSSYSFIVWPFLLYSWDKLEWVSFFIFTT